MFDINKVNTQTKSVDFFWQNCGGRGEGEGRGERGEARSTTNE